MAAIIVTGGKQYNVNVGDTLKVELLEAEVKAKVKLPVLLISNEKEVVTGDAAKSAYATVEVLEHGVGEKLAVFKYKPKKNERKRHGHRQPYTVIKVLEVKAK